MFDVRRYSINVAIVVAFVLSCVPMPARAQAAGPRRDGHALVRVTVTSLKDLTTMAALGAESWNCVPGLGEMDYSLSPAALDTLRQTGLKFTTTHPNVQQLIDDERARIMQAAANDDGGIAGDAWFSDFKTWPQVNSYLTDLAALNPTIATTFTAGTTIENRDIRGIRITGPGVGKPAILISATQHAREWVAPMTAMYVADQLMSLYGVDPQITSLINQVEFIIVPIVNPDGYEYSYAPGGDRLWRKNRRPNLGGTFGVDLNRNWDFQWNGGDSNSTDPSNDVYVGTAAFSEPESQALRDLVLANPQLAAHIDFHSYGQYILEAWSHTYADAPAKNMVDALGTSMNQGIFGVNSVNYSNGWGGSLLYLADGTFPDWCHGTRNLLSYTIELRDKGTTGFILPAAEILPTCRENLPAVLEMARYAMLPAATFSYRGLPRTLVADQPTTINLRIDPLPNVSLIAPAPALRWRIGTSGAFNSIALTSLGGTQYQVALPAAPCGATVQYYFEANTSRGVYQDPPSGAPVSSHQALALTPLLTFNFQTDAGWTTQTQGATAGLWQRGTPVNDVNWPYDPAIDADASGQCWLTQNTLIGPPLFQSDVDNGSTILISPALNFTGQANPIVVSYAYFLHAVSPGITDFVKVEISANDLAGPWVELARHGMSAMQWRRHRITQAEFTGAGVALTSTMRLRFTATDGSPQNIVEAGIDDVRVGLDCGAPIVCAADIAPLPSGDGAVNVQDLLAVISAWGAGAGNPADIAPPGGDGIVNVADLLAVIAAWGPCD